MSLASPPDTDLKPASETSLERDPLAERGTFRIGLAYGRFVYRFRWLILAFWCVVVAVSIIFALRTVPLLGTGENSIQSSQSGQVTTILKTQFHQNTSQAYIALQSSMTTVSDSAYQKEITSLTTKLQHTSGIQNVMLNPSETDGKTTMLIVESQANKDLPISQIRTVLHDTSGPAKTYLTGTPAFNDEITTTSLEDVEHIDSLTMPIALLLLIVIFGTMVAAALPLVLVMVALPLTLALLYPVALHSPTSTYMLSVCSIVGLGIAIDYSLFIVRRFREELALGLHPREAIGWTIATAGEAILFSGLIVMIGFIGLLLIGLGLTTSIGIGGALLVISTVLGALTFLPALLCILGDRINALRAPYLWRFSMSTGTETAGRQEKFWGAVASRVMRRPVLTVLLSCIVLVSLAWPVFSLRVGPSSLSSLPNDSEARQGFSILAKQYPALNTQSIDLIVELPDHSSPLTAKNLQNLVQLTNWLKAQPHVTGVTSLMQLPSTGQSQSQNQSQSQSKTQAQSQAQAQSQSTSASLTQEQLIALYTTGAYQQSSELSQFVSQYTASNMMHVTVSSDAAENSDASTTLVNTMRDHASSVVSGWHVLVGGDQASNMDFDSFLFGRFIWTVLFIMLATFVLLAIMFRSLVLPLKAVIVNVLSISVSCGVQVFIFQWGHWSGLLDFTSEGYVNNISLVLLFCLLFGLSMDYEVFLLSRIHELWMQTKDNRHAVATGLEKTGSVITNAALLFMLVTVAFSFTRELEIKSIGIGLTTAILVDATVIRSLLVPATMRLLGKWCWWFPGIKNA